MSGRQEYTVGGNGCGGPYCSGKYVIIGETDLATVMPDLAAEWHPFKNGDLKPKDVTLGSSKKVWWQCKKDMSGRHLYTVGVMEQDVHIVKAKL